MVQRTILWSRGDFSRPLGREDLGVSSVGRNSLFYPQRTTVISIGLEKSVILTNWKCFLLAIISQMRKIGLAVWG